MSGELPTGTVTFLFTDIEGSTRLLEELGDGYAELLDDHRRAVRGALLAHRGAEVDTQGDSFFAAFASARDAAEAAAEIQRALAGTSARVRIGLHTGEAGAGPDGYVGMDVHRAARICGVAHGGQILVSQATSELIDAPTRDLGEHRLKDLTAPQRLHQLLVDGLPDSFPPPRTLDAAPTNLPVEPTALVGRERELREARDLLAREDVRLLTLTGPAGAGKTRLALQLAADCVEECDDGVFFVDLSSVHDPGLVVPAIAQTLGLRESPGRPAAQALVEFLARKHVLLVVDNVEQVVEAAPELGRLLGSCERLEIVATSREPLRLAAEQEYPVPPLSAAESVELFAERARAVRPGFDVDGDRATIEAICARLDGLPLAIELAAARVKLLPPPKLLERLDQRLPLLTGGARDAPERQQTLRAAIDWSFELLDPDDQELFARLSVFDGGCTLEAAEAVCDATIDGVASLVDKSLLTERAGTSGEHRFVMLETVHEYAGQRLEQAGALVPLGRRHAEYFLAISTRERTFHDPTSEEADRMYDELANFRAAIVWFRTAGDAEHELLLAMAVWEHLWTRGLVPELRGWLLSALGRPGDVDRGTMTDALAATAFAAHVAGEAGEAQQRARESVALARELGDKRRIEWATRLLTFAEEDQDRRWQLLRECEALLRELGDDEGLAWVAYMQADTLQLSGQHASSREQGERAVELFDRFGLRWEVTNARILVGMALVGEHRDSEAASIATDALREMAEGGAIGSIAESLDVLAAARLASDPGLATRLLAASARIREHYGEPGERVFREFAARTKSVAREQLSGEFEREWEAGWALTTEEAVALGLDDVDPGTLA